MTIQRIIQSLVLLVSCLTGWGADWYVATNGTAGGAGTIGDPLSLSKAISATSPAVSGDTIYVLAGTYSGFYTNYLEPAGTPITVRASGRAIIESTGFTDDKPALNILGSNTWFWGLEVRDPATNRLNQGRNEGIYVHSPGAKIINCVLHDNNDGILPMSESIGAEVYGCIIYNNGRQETNRSHGHGVYCQNATGTMTLRDNLIFNNFYLGVQGYSEGAATYVRNITANGNITWENGSPATNGYRQAGLFFGTFLTYMDGILITNNVSMQTGMGSGDTIKVGYRPYGPTNNAVTVVNNYMGNGSFRVEWFTNATVNGNTWRSSFSDPNVSIIWVDTTQVWPWDSNTYSSAAAQPFEINLTTNHSFATWTNATGYDVASTISTSVTNTDSFLRVNAYDSNLCYVAIANWSGASNITMDLSSWLANGDNYTIKHASDYYGATVASGSYSGAITLASTGYTPVAPTGWTNSPETGPVFNVFVVERGEPSPPAHVRSLRVNRLIVR